MSGLWVVEVEYRLASSVEENRFGTFRSERAAERFAEAIKAWDAKRVLPDDGSGVRHVYVCVKPLTKPMLEFIQEDVERASLEFTFKDLSDARKAGA